MNADYFVDADYVLGSVVEYVKLHMSKLIVVA